MLKPPGLLDDQFDDWVAAYRGSTSTFSEVIVRTLDGALVDQLHPIGGQVDVDADEDVTRKASLTLYDPGRVLDGFEAMQFMLHVYDVTFVPGIGHVRCPTFTGPIIAPPNRNQSEVTVSLEDPSHIGMRGVPPKTYPKGMLATEAIRLILIEKCGEFAKNIKFPASPKRLPAPGITVGWQEELWPTVQIVNIAEDVLGWQFYYDGDGKARLRDEPKQPLISLDGLLTSEPTEEATGEIINRVQVEGSKPAYQGAAGAVDSHPISSWTLRRNGVRRYYNQVESDNKAKSDAAAAARAGRILNRALADLREGKSFTIAPLPNLEPLDVVSFDNDRLTLDVFSFPVNGGDQTIGYDAPVSALRSKRVAATAAPKKKKAPKKRGRRKRGKK